MLQEVLTALIAPVAGAVGWFGQRWITGARHKDEAGRLISAVDLAERLQQAGMSLADARIAADAIRAGAPALPVSTAQTVAQAEEEDSPSDLELPIGYSSTYAMRMRLSARLESLDAQMAEALTELHLLLSEDEADSSGRAHEAWLVYRTAEGEFSGSSVSGGTAEPVYALAAMIAVTEPRLAQLRALVREKKAQAALEVL